VGGKCGEDTKMETFIAAKYAMKFLQKVCPRACQREGAKRDMAK